MDEGTDRDIPGLRRLRGSLGLVRRWDNLVPPRWRSKNKRAIPVSKMETSHLENTHRYVVRRLEDAIRSLRGRNLHQAEITKALRDIDQYTKWDVVFCEELFKRGARPGVSPPTRMPGRRKTVAAKNPKPTRTVALEDRLPPKARQVHVRRIFFMEDE